MSNNIDNLIQSTKQRLTSERDELEKRYADKIDEAATKYARTDRDSTPRKVRRARGRLHNFEVICDNLPREFTFQVSTPNQNPEKTKKLRRYFDKATRAYFIQTISQKQSPQLLKMGIPQEGIFQMREFGRLPDLNGEIYDATIDHKNEIGMIGGTNDLSNLSLVPEHINYLRNAFIMSQVWQLPEGSNILSLMYTSKDWIPEFPDGFRCKNSQFNKDRASQYLSAELH